MNEVIRTRNPWRTVAMVLLGVLVLLVVTLAAILQPAAPIGAGGRAVTRASTQRAPAGLASPKIRTSTATPKWLRPFTTLSELCVIVLFREYGDS
jgi:hypothetical protein